MRRIIAIIILIMLEIASLAYFALAVGLAYDIHTGNYTILKYAKTHLPGLINFGKYIIQQSEFVKEYEYKSLNAEEWRLILSSFILGVAALILILLHRIFYRLPGVFAMLGSVTWAGFVGWTAATSKAIRFTHMHSQIWSGALEVFIYTYAHSYSTLLFTFLASITLLKLFTLASDEDIEHRTAEASVAGAKGNIIHMMGIAFVIIALYIVGKNVWFHRSLLLYWPWWQGILAQIWILFYYFVFPLPYILIWYNRVVIKYPMITVLFVAGVSSIGLLALFVLFVGLALGLAVAGAIGRYSGWITELVGITEEEDIYTNTKIVTYHYNKYFDPDTANYWTSLISIAVGIIALAFSFLFIALLPGIFAYGIIALEQLIVLFI